MRPARSETEVISPPSTRVSRWTTGSATDRFMSDYPNHRLPNGSRPAPALRSRLGDAIGLEALDELGRTAQGDEVAALDFVGLDPEALPRDAPLEVCREEPVVATDQDPRWHLGPRLERPGLCHGCPRLLRLATPQGLLTDLRRDVMEVQGRVVVGSLSRQPKGGQVGEHLLVLADV